MIRKIFLLLLLAGCAHQVPEKRMGSSATVSIDSQGIASISGAAAHTVKSSPLMGVYNGTTLLPISVTATGELTLSGSSPTAPVVTTSQGQAAITIGTNPFKNVFSTPTLGVYNGTTLLPIAVDASGNVMTTGGGGGGGISALTGDVTASGSGSVPATVVSAGLGTGPFAAGTTTLSGNLLLSQIGNETQLNEGFGDPGAAMGVIQLLFGGTVTVPNTLVTANSRIFLTNIMSLQNPGAVSVSTIVPGTSFTIQSTSASDSSIIAWEIVEPINPNVNRCGYYFLPTCNASPGPDDCCNLDGACQSYCFALYSNIYNVSCSAGDC
jgi:hypothetical protein